MAEVLTAAAAAGVVLTMKGLYDLAKGVYDRCMAVRRDFKESRDRLSERVKTVTATLRSYHEFEDKNNISFHTDKAVFIAMETVKKRLERIDEFLGKLEEKWAVKKAWKKDDYEEDFKTQIEDIAFVAGALTNAVQTLMIPHLPGLERGDRCGGRGDIRAEPDDDGYFKHCYIPSVSAEEVRVQQNLDECYDMGTNEKGLAFLLNLRDYENSGMEIRRGSEKDVANIRHVMGQAGFSFQKDMVLNDMVLPDLGEQQIKKTYTKFVERCKGSNNLKCIVVILMAHGGLGYICCEETYKKKKIPLRFFFDRLEQTSEFKDIPKIFIIEAGRQENFNDDALNLPNPIPETHSIRIYSTSEGAGSITDFSKGSIFTQAFVKVLLENAHREHLLDMLRKVREELRQDTPERDMRSQIPTWEENLKKKLYLIPHTT